MLLFPPLALGTGSRPGAAPVAVRTDALNSSTVAETAEHELESNPDRQSRWSRPRWYELLPELLLAAGLMFFLIDEPDAATSAFKSNRAVGLMAAAAVLWIAGRVVLARFLHARLARTALFGLAGLVSWPLSWFPPI